MSTDAYTFGQWLEKKLMEAGFSQSELARRAEMSRGAINGVIKGVRHPGNGMLLAISKALNISREEVFQAAGYIPKRSNVDLEKLNHKLSLLPEEERQDIFDYIDMKLKQEERKREGRQA